MIPNEIIEDFIGRAKFINSTIMGGKEQGYRFTYGDKYIVIILIDGEVAQMMVTSNRFLAGLVADRIVIYPFFLNKGEDWKQRNWGRVRV